jgi:hypothetical protein
MALGTYPVTRINQTPNAIATIVGVGAGGLSFSLARGTTQTTS